MTSVKKGECESGRGRRTGMRPEGHGVVAMASVKKGEGRAEAGRVFPLWLAPTGWAQDGQQTAERV